ncbi:hypothetical protein [Halorussus sp. AFM4]|uniref:hypothetical protein n=1 Tax=Halorussus sp. AFM4 TaxID=3421651 RepID=UPI003EB8CF35
MFLLALFVRVLAIPLSIIEINPYSKGDANGFEASAIFIANQLQNGVVPVVRIRYIYEVWGFLLSPFWLLPGPSAIYARLLIAILGAIAVYNIYVTACWYQSSRAGVLAALPVAFFPSFVLVHATLLREAVVIFGLTTTVRLIFVPSRLKRFEKFTVVAVALGLATVVRLDNLPVYLITIFVGILAVYVKNRGRRWALNMTFLASLVSIPYLIEVLQRIVGFLVMVHGNRARGRTAYFKHVVPETVAQFVAFSWIGAMYFYLTPFPWMVSQPSDLIVFVEAVCNAIYGLAAIKGVRLFLRRNASGTFALLVGFGLISVFYGVATANVGTAVRHRQMFVWILYLFGGVYLAHRVEIRY